MHTESTRLKGVKGKNFEADIEYNQNIVAIHLPVIKVMNRETVLEMREMLKHWNQFFKTVGYEETYAAFDIEDDKMKKLVRLLNFEYIRDNLGFSIFRYIGE
jgi:hypothetical protein|tara:strand:- start:385 stop:690 length:306 start_codon:yes stop_codon:yes gene_type:complete